MPVLTPLYSYLLPMSLSIIQFPQARPLAGCSPSANYMFSIAVFYNTLLLVTHSYFMAVKFELN